MPPHAVDAAKELLERRLADLDDERGRLERALKELGGKASGRGGSPAGGGKPKRRRRRKGGTRADQALALIAKRPGIVAREIASKLKTKPANLYPVLGDLEKQGRVRKDGKRYFPVS